MTTTDPYNFGNCIRDRPFNLKRGGLWFFVSFRNFFFPTTQELEYYFFYRAKCEIFFQHLTLSYMTKTLNQIFLFFLHQNQNIFFSIGNQNIFLEKNHNPPLQVKWSFPKMFVNLEVYHLFHHFWNKVIHLCKNFVSSLFLFCTLGIVVNIVADKVSIGSAGDMFQNRNIEGMCNLFSTIHHNHQEICFRTAILKGCVICSLLYTIISRRYVLEQQY
jgi:hypothetical protein